MSLYNNKEVSDYTFFRQEYFYKESLYSALGYLLIFWTLLFRCTPDLERSLVATGKNVIEKDGILATRLCTHKEDVNEINNLKLNQLEGENYCGFEHGCPQGSRSKSRHLFPSPWELKSKISLDKEPFFLLMKAFFSMSVFLGFF